MTQLTIRTLGPPELALDGAAVDTSRNKAIALLVYLAVNGQRCRREALAGLFWPDYEQSKAYAYLRRTLWEIKEMLGEGWLEVDRETVGLAGDANYWLDHHAFRQALASTAAHAHAPAAVCPDCIQPLSQAVELYRGDFLAGFSLRDSPGFDDWQFYLSEGLRQEAGEALRKLSAIQGQERRLDAAIEAGRRWLSLDPLNEEAHRQVMLLHALHGQRSAALRQYQECVRILQAEMGIAPERKTTELHQRIEQGQIPAIDGAAPLPASSVASPFPGPPRPAHFNLPQLLTPFVGRERELAELHGLLADPEVRLLTVLAVGGMGKTRLAIEAAARHCSSMDEGVIFVYLAPLQTPSAIAPALLDALGLEAREGASPKAQVLDYLREKRLLLVLDNFEHLLSHDEGSHGAGLVSEILQQAPGVKVLATSRLPLNLQGEHRYHLAGLDFPTSSRSDDLLSFSAVKLFVQGARRAAPGFKLSSEDMQPVAAICRLAEGMPLGILLAAGWAEMLSPQQIHAQMHSQQDFLETDLQDVPERQRSMRLVLQHTWQLMSDQERTAFERLSVLRGVFDRQAAQQVSGAALRVLMALINKSLLIRLPEDQLAMHELLRQYAAERLTDDVDAYQEAHDRHSAFYCARLHQWAQAIKNPRDTRDLPDVDRESENARAAWAWAALDRQVDRLAAAAEGLGLLLSWYNPDEAGDKLFQLAVDALQGTESDQERRLLGYLLAWQALFASARARTPDQVRALIRRSQDLLAGVAPTPETNVAQGLACFVEGTTALGALDYPAAEAALERSLALFEQAGDTWWMARVLEALGNAAWVPNDLERTRAYFLRSQELRKAMGDQIGMASLLTSLGGLLGFDLGRVDEAERAYSESSRIFQEAGSRIGIAASLLSRQALARLHGRFPEALELIQQQMAILTELGDRGQIANLRMVLGEVYQLMGQYDQAVAEHRINMAGYDEAGWQGPETWERWALAAALLGRGDFEEVIEVIRPNIEALERSGSKSLLGRSLAVLSRAELALHQPDAAWTHALRGVGLLADRHYFWLLEALAAAAGLLASRGEAVRAVEIYTLLNRHPYVANSRWFDELYGSLVDQAAAGLAPAALAEAKARTETLDLWQAARELMAAYPPTTAASDQTSK